MNHPDDRSREQFVNRQIRNARGSRWLLLYIMVAALVVYAVAAIISTAAAVW